MVGPTPKLRMAIFELLEKRGEMSCEQIAAVMNRKKNTISDCLVHTRHMHGTKYFRITSWSPRALYAPGPAPDAERPKKFKTAEDRIQHLLRKPAHPFSGLGGL